MNTSWLRLRRLRTISHNLQIDRFHCIARRMYEDAVCQFTVIAYPPQALVALRLTARLPTMRYSGIGGQTIVSLAITYAKRRSIFMLYYFRIYTSISLVGYTMVLKLYFQSTLLTSNCMKYYNSNEYFVIIVIIDKNNFLRYIFSYPIKKTCMA